MTGSQDLSELLERVEGATGADRALDCDIAVALGLWTPPKGYERDPQQPDKWRRGGINHYQPHEPVTASLDAALALVERCGVNAELLMWDAVSDTYHWVERVSDYRQRLVLSVLAALLKALQAQASATQHGSQS